MSSHVSNIDYSNVNTVTPGAAKFQVDVEQSRWVGWEGVRRWESDQNAQSMYSREQMNMSTAPNYPHVQMFFGMRYGVPTHLGSGKRSQ